MYAVEKFGIFALCYAHNPHSLSWINAKSKVIKFLVTRKAQADQVGQLIDVREPQLTEKRLFSLTHSIVYANVEDVGCVLFSTIVAAAKARGVVGFSTSHRISRVP